MCNEVRDTRVCCNCGSAMDEGYVVQGETYCVETCLPIPVEVYNKMHEDLPDENYWTEWEDIYY